MKYWDYHYRKVEEKTISSDDGDGDSSDDDDDDSYDDNGDDGDDNNGDDGDDKNIELLRGKW